MEGAGVTTSRGDVHYVVTEFGVVNLHGRTIRQRAELLISIAHPSFREELEVICERASLPVRRIFHGIKGTVTFNIETCKGCELCIDACPQESLGLSGEINAQGYHYAVLVKDNCTGCINCALVCPDAVITVYREDRKSGKVAGGTDQQRHREYHRHNRRRKEQPVSDLKLMKGNEALAEAAIRAGCKAYFGYPITPQSEILEYLADEGRAARDDRAAGGKRSRVHQHGVRRRGRGRPRDDVAPRARGSASCRKGSPTSRAPSSPASSSTSTAADPGSGRSSPRRGTTSRRSKGGGHGDYRLIVLAPSSVQEMADFVFDAFDLADKYRTPVMILADGALGQMMEKVEFREYDPAEHVVAKPWATTGKPTDRERNIITSLHIEPEKMEQINIHLQDKYRLIAENETRCEQVHTDDAEYLIVALRPRGAHRPAGGGDRRARRESRPACSGPITLFPYPYGGDPSPLPTGCGECWSWR